MLETREMYGSDIDGNRGVMVTEYEIDEDDFENIRDILLEEVAENQLMFDDEVIITLYGSNDEEVEFEVSVSDYISITEYDEVTELP